MSVVDIAGVYEQIVKFMLPWFLPINSLAEEFVEVDFRGKFEAVVYLQGRVRIIPTIHRRCKYS